MSKQWQESAVCRCVQYDSKITEGALFTTVRGDGGRDELAQEGGCDQTGPRCGSQNWSRKQETGATACGWAKLNHGVPKVSAFWTTLLTLRNTIRQHGANHLLRWWCPVVLIYKTKRNRTVGQTSRLSQRYTFPSHDFWVACLYPTVCLINLSNFWFKVYSSTKERGPNIKYINSWNREQEGKKNLFCVVLQLQFLPFCCGHFSCSRPHILLIFGGNL